MLPENDAFTVVAEHNPGTDASSATRKNLIFTIESPQLTKYGRGSAAMVGTA